MAPQELRATQIPYGRRKGRTLDDVASTRSGLLWLDAQRAREWTVENHPDLAKAITEYLAQPAVARELAEAVGR